mgnify:CR=1 FL=1
MFSKMLRIASRLAPAFALVAGRLDDAGTAAVARHIRPRQAPAIAGDSPRSPAQSPCCRDDGIARRFGRMAWPPERRVRLRR